VTAQSFPKFKKQFFVYIVWNTQ